MTYSFNYYTSVWIFFINLKANKFNIFYETFSIVNFQVYTAPMLFAQSNYYDMNTEYSFAVFLHCAFQTKSDMLTKIFHLEQL